MSFSRESKVGSNVLEWYPHLMHEKRKKPSNCRSCRQGLYLEINFADLCKVFAWTVIIYPLKYLIFTLCVLNISFPRAIVIIYPLKYLIFTLCGLNISFPPAIVIIYPLKYLIFTLCVLNISFPSDHLSIEIPHLYIVCVKY